MRECVWGRSGNRPVAPPRPEECINTVMMFECEASTSFKQRCKNKPPPVRNVKEEVWWTGVRVHEAYSSIHPPEHKHKHLHINTDFHLLTHTHTLVFRQRCFQKTHTCKHSHTCAHIHTFAHICTHTHSHTKSPVTSVMVHIAVGVWPGNKTKAWYKLSPSYFGSKQANCHGTGVVEENRPLTIIAV